jgi:hypothetical protein
MNDSHVPEGSFGDFLADAERLAHKIIQETNKAPKDAWEAWTAFAAAVRWTEPWLVGLLSFHGVCLGTALLARKRAGVQCVLFLVICALVFMAERINTLCSQHWQTFATQNYFDRHGVFASILFAGPLLFVATVILVSSRTCACVALQIVRVGKSSKKISSLLCVAHRTDKHAATVIHSTDTSKAPRTAPAEERDRGNRGTAQ